MDRGERMQGVETVEGLIQIMSDTPGKLHIAAVFATMNRAQTAVSCVKALAGQTRPPDRVIVADNVSSDDTAAALLAMQGLPFDLIVHRMKENRGNAGGVQEAMDLAFSMGADAVWILDDDSWPRPDALEALCAGSWDPRVVRHSMQVDPKTGRFTWPLQVACGERQWRLAGSLEEMPAGDFVKSRIIWTGALLPKTVRDAVGPVNGELFIRGEDEEYPRRIERSGFTQEAVVKSILDHPGPQSIQRFGFLGKSLFYETGLADWKLYYKVRNMVWLKRGYSGGISAMAMALAYAAAAAWLDGPRRLPLIAEAAIAGWRGRLGKWSGQP